jgi:hypothetical protein
MISKSASESTYRRWNNYYYFQPQCKSICFCLANFHLSINLEKSIIPTLQVLQQELASILNYPPKMPTNALGNLSILPTEVRTIIYQKVLKDIPIVYGDRSFAKKPIPLLGCSSLLRLEAIATIKLCSIVTVTIPARLDRLLRNHTLLPCHLRIKFPRADCCCDLVEHEFSNPWVLFFFNLQEWRPSLVTLASRKVKGAKVVVEGLWVSDSGNPWVCANEMVDVRWMWEGKVLVGVVGDRDMSVRTWCGAAACACPREN